MDYIYLLGLICVSIFASCSVSHYQNRENITPQDIAGQDIHIKLNSSGNQHPISISEVKMFAWWWDESTVQKGIDGDNPPPRSKYVEIVEWEYDGEGLTTYPHKIDFVSTFVNHSAIDTPRIVVITLSGRFENYDEIVTLDSVNDSTIFLSEKFEKIPWVDLAVIYRKKIDFKGDKEKRIEIKDHNIEYILNQEFQDKPICAIRVVAQLMDMSGNIVDSKEKIVRIKLGD